MRSSPFASTYVRSASATVRCARCSTSRIETPRSRISASAAKTVSTRVGERPSDGSSRSSTSGAATSARPIASCCCWPPESAPAWRSRKSASIGKSSYAAASGSEPLRRRRAESPSRRFSSTDSSPKMRLPSGTSAMPARAIVSGERPRTDWPERRTSPAAGGTTPMIACRVVDLPAPFGPIRPTSSARPTSRLSPRTAGTEPYRTSRFCSSRTAVTVSLVIRRPRSRRDRPT